MEPGRGPSTQALGRAGRWARGPPLCPALRRLPKHPPAGREPTGLQRKEAGTKPRTHWMGGRALVTPQACACPEAPERHGLWAAPSPYRWPHDRRDHRVWGLGGATPAQAAPCCPAGPRSESHNRPGLGHSRLPLLGAAQSKHTDTRLRQCRPLTHRRDHQPGPTGGALSQRGQIQPQHLQRAPRALRELPALGVSTGCHPAESRLCVGVCTRVCASCGHCRLPSLPGP